MKSAGDSCPVISVGIFVGVRGVSLGEGIVSLFTGLPERVGLAVIIINRKGVGVFLEIAVANWNSVLVAVLTGLEVEIFGWGTTTK